MLTIDVLRATTERTAQTRVHCAVCGTEFELGPVYAWLAVGGYGPDELCERCLRGLCEWAVSEGLDVAWKDAHSIYRDACARYPEPMVSAGTMEAMSFEDQDRLIRESHLTLCRD